MKLVRLLPLVLAAGLCHAAPLTTTTAIQTQPDPSAPSIGYLKAGTEPATAGEAPEGWIAVSVPGPFEVYVRASDLTKQLDVVPGTALYLQPSLTAPVLTKAAKGDKVEITGLHGKWTQLRLNQPVVGYIHPGSLPAPVPAAADPLAPGPAPDAPVSPAPPPTPSTAAGRPADPENAASASLLRVVQGTFVSSQKLFLPRRPFDWQLSDPTGARLAFLDVSKLLLTEQMDKYVGHEVAVYGAVTPVPGGKDVVVRVESLQLK